MMSKRSSLAVLGIGLLVLSGTALVPVAAQTPSNPSAGLSALPADLTSLPRSILGFNFLDPSRMSFSHQFSTVYSSAGGGMSSMYFNTLTYQISDPLTLRLHLGYAFQPMAPRNAGMSQSSQVIPGFEMDYRPFGGKLNLHLSYNTPNSYYDPFFYSPSRQFYSR